MPQFLYRIQPTRPEMLTEGLTPAEESAVTDHFNYLVRLADAGVVHLFGRTQNNDASSFGLCIFEVADEPSARAVMEDDPAVRAGVMRAELFPYLIAGVGRGLRDRPASEGQAV
jgi:uncharacterized protein